MNSKIRELIGEAAKQAFYECPYPVAIPARALLVGTSFLAVQRAANDGNDFAPELVRWVGGAIRAIDGSTADDYDGLIFSEVDAHIARAKALHQEIPYAHAERVGLIAEEIFEAQEQSARVVSGGTYWMAPSLVGDAHRNERREILDAIAVAIRVLDAMMEEQTAAVFGGIPEAVNPAMVAEAIPPAGGTP